MSIEQPACVVAQSSLFDVLGQSPGSATIAADIAIELADVVAHMHNIGDVHGQFGACIVQNIKSREILGVLLYAMSVRSALHRVI
jgi:hypothetical protein